jgi:hypothetical protein
MLLLFYFILIVLLLLRIQLPFSIFLHFMFPTIPLHLMFFHPLLCLIRKSMRSGSDQIAINPKRLAVTANHPQRVGSSNGVR